MALKQFNWDTAADDNTYRDAITGDEWVVMWWILDPAVVLMNKRTGERHTEIIGCQNAERWIPVPATEKLSSD